MKIDSLNIDFKDGANYIVGSNASGKSTVFNCIKYALGITRKNNQPQIQAIELNILIDDAQYKFHRTAESAKLTVLHENRISTYQAQSEELESFLSDVLKPTYMYETNTESTLDILNFCFLSEEHSNNRRLQWESISSICGINTRLLRSTKNDIDTLKSEITQNKILETTVNAFSDLLENEKPDITQEINNVKKIFFKPYRDTEELYINASLKLEMVANHSNQNLRDKLLEISERVHELSDFSAKELGNLEDLESFIKGGKRVMSYGEETSLRFILVLAIAQKKSDLKLNFPQLIVNDCYLSLNDYESRNKIQNIINTSLLKNNNLQYIEFTRHAPNSKDDVILDMNSAGARHAFNN